MAGTFISVYWCEEFIPITEIYTMYRTRLTRLRVGWERTNEVLPALQSIYLEGLHPSGIGSQEIGHFINARRLSGRLRDSVERQDTSSNIDGRLG